MLSAVAGNEQLRQFADNPKVPAEQVYQVVAAASNQQLEPGVQNFLRAVIENGRLAVLPEAAAQFRTMRFNGIRPPAYDSVTEGNRS